MPAALLFLALALLRPVPGAAVTIYRFGGTDLPPPAEVGQPGVRFRQLSWSALGVNGENRRLAEVDGRFGPSRRNPLTTLPLRDYNTGLAPLFDWNPLDCGVCEGLTLKGYRCGVCSGRYGEQGTVDIDLGERLFVERVQIRSGDADGLGVVEDLAIYLSPEPLVGAAVRTPFAAVVTGNRKAVLDVTGFPQLQRSAAIQLALPEHEAPVHLSEVFVYASGESGQASYLSDILDFGRPAVWGVLRWSLDPAPGSRVTLAARGGDDVEVLRYWRYTGVGDQRLGVTRNDYLRLRTHERAGTTYNYDSWSQWPAEFDLAAEGASPPLFLRPRRALQFRLEFESLGAEASDLGFFELRASEAAVSEVVGELAPIHVQPGAVTDFTFTLKPRLAAADGGFDRVQVGATAARLDTVLGVRIDGYAVPFEVTALDEQRLVVALPRVGQAQSDAIVEVAFRAQVLRFGAAFAAHLLDSARPYDVPQPVPAGDAVDDVFSDRLWIETTIAVHSVLDAGVWPPVFTPNGDGVNDEVRVAYDLFETTGGVPVRVEVLDLAGHPVCLVHDGVEEIGRYERLWDGRDQAGAPVRPGLYLCRVTARVGGADEAWTGVVGVAY